MPPPPEPRRGASRHAKSKGAGTARESEVDNSDPGQPSQTSSAAVAMPAADFPESTKDKEFIVIRSNYNSSKITAVAAMEQIQEMVLSMQGKVDAGAAESVLRRTAKRLQVSMENAEDAVDEQIVLGTIW